MKKKIIIILLIILAIILGFLVFKKYFVNKGNEPGATGHFYGQPKSIKEVEYIEVRYDSKKLITIDIAGDVIEYYAFDENGNFIKENGEIKINSKNGVSDEIKDYIIKTVVPKAKKQSYDPNSDWYVSIKQRSSSCTVSGTGNTPDWFDKLLIILEYDKYEVNE